MFKTSVFFIVVFSFYCQYAEAIYARYTTRRMRYKLCALERELIRDSRSKVQAIWYMRRHYSESTSFQLGQMVYNVRRKYNRLVFVYMRSLAHMPKKELEIDFFADHLREVHHQAFDIDNMIQAIEEWEDRKSRKKRITRMGRPAPEEDPEAIAKRMDIERLKQRAYIERKKILWSMRQGNTRDNLGRSQFQKRDPVVEGFES